jgi:hypothetical protein
VVVSGTFTGTGAGTIDFASGYLTVAASNATLDVPGSLFQWTGGAIVGATLTIPSGSVVNVSGQGYHYLENVTVDNAGTINFDGLGALSFAEGVADTSPGILNNTGTLDFLGDEAVTNNSVEAPGTINNSGTLLVSGGTGEIPFYFVDFNNAASGTVEVDSGTLALWGGMNAGGTYNVAAGSVLNLTQGQNATFTGTYTGSGAGTVQLTGGTITIGSAGATFNFPAGLFQWTGGARSTPTGASLNLDGVVSLAGSSYEDLSGGGIVNVGGMIEQTGGGSLRLDGLSTTSTTLNIPAGSTYIFQGDSGIVQGFGAGGSVNNMGTITKSAGVGTSTISSGFNNLGGTLNVQSGTLTLAPAGGANNGGTFTVASGAALDLTGGQTVVYAGTYAGSGSGQVQLNSGTLAVACGSGGATFRVPNGVFRWSGGTINTNNSTLTIAHGKSIELTGFGGETLDGGGTLSVYGTVDQSGVGNLSIGGGTTLRIGKGGTYDLENDSGIVAGFGLGGIVVNAGTLTKTVGTNISTISTPLDNMERVVVMTGTLDVTGAVSQVSGTTLAAGTWDADSSVSVASTLTFANPANLTAIGPGATVALAGPNAAFTNLASLASNAGSLSLTQGAAFTTSGSFTNSGTFTLGAGDSLSVNGIFAQTASGTIDISIAGPSSNGKFSTLTATGAATLDGTLVVNVASGTSFTVGDVYVIVSYASETGTFTKIKFVNLPAGISLVPAYNAQNFTLTVSGSSAAASTALPAAAQSGTPGGTASISAPAEAHLASRASTTAARRIHVALDRMHPGHGRMFRSLKRLDAVKHGVAASGKRFVVFE